MKISRVFALQLVPADQSGNARASLVGRLFTGFVVHPSKILRLHISLDHSRKFCVDHELVDMRLVKLRLVTVTAPEMVEYSLIKMSH